LFLYIELLHVAIVFRKKKLACILILDSAIPIAGDGLPEEIGEMEGGRSI